MIASHINSLVSVTGGSVDTVEFGHGRHFYAGGNSTIAVGSGVTIANSVVAGFATKSFKSGSGSITNAYTGLSTDSVSDPGNSLLTGLVAFWHMTEATSASRVDSSGNGHTLANNGTVQQIAAPGQTGNVAYFDNNASDYLSTAGAAFTASGTGFTFTGWVYMLNLTDNHIFVMKNTSGSCSPCEWTLYWNPPSAGTAGFQANVNGVATASVLTGATTNTWYFVAGGFDPVAGKAWISVNNGGITQSGSTTAHADSGNPLTIGSGVSIASYYYGGHSGFWNRVLTSAELTTLYHAGAFYDPL
jgi:hypothetical protein